MLPIIHFGQASHSATPESGVRVAVSPAVHGSLDEASLPSQGHIQMRQSPANPVAVCLIHQAVAAILVLGAAGPGIDAVLLLKLLRQLLGIYGLHIASDGVFHLHAVSGILKGNPLDPVTILPYYQWSCRRNWTWCGAGGCPKIWTLMVCTAWWKRRSGSRMWWVQESPLRRCSLLNSGSSRTSQGGIWWLG